MNLQLPGQLTPEDWEALRHMTVDRLITHTKLNGSAFGLNGFTTPEGWPFMVVIAVAKPGNEDAVGYAREFHDKLAERAKLKSLETNPDLPPHPANPTE